VLGVVKIQALALSGTGTARARSLVAFAAASLASTLHADRAYWANVSADPAINVNVANSTLTAADPALLNPPPGGCTTASPCTLPAQLVAQDLRDWTDSLRTILPASSNPTAAVTCQIPGNSPVSCAIHITWTENLVTTPYSTNMAASAQQTAQAVQQAEPVSYTLYAEP
jgi:Tfp pilus assembly protein PilV